MTIKLITGILSEHHINYSVRDGRVLAEEHWTSADGSGVDIIDVTDYSLKSLLSWLGY